MHANANVSKMRRPARPEGRGDNRKLYKRDRSKARRFRTAVKFAGLMILAGSSVSHGAEPISDAPCFAMAADVTPEAVAALVAAGFKL